MLRGTAFAQYNTIFAQQKAESRNINLRGTVCAQYRPVSRNKNRRASDCAQLPDWHFLSLLRLPCQLQRIDREPQHFADYDAAFVRSLVNSGFRFGGRHRSKLHIAAGSLNARFVALSFLRLCRFTAGKSVLLSDARDGFLFDRLFGFGLVVKTGDSLRCAKGLTRSLMPHLPWLMVSELLSYCPPPLRGGRRLPRQI
jgi:hypothetical protein